MIGDDHSSKLATSPAIQMYDSDPAAMEDLSERGIVFNLFGRWHIFGLQNE